MKERIFLSFFPELLFDPVERKLPVAAQFHYNTIGKETVHPDLLWHEVMPPELSRGRSHSTDFGRLSNMLFLTSNHYLLYNC